MSPPIVGWDSTHNDLARPPSDGPGVCSDDQLSGPAFSQATGRKVRQSGAMTTGSEPRRELLCVAEGSCCDGQRLVSSLNASGMQARLVPGSTDWIEQGQPAEADLLLLLVSEPGLGGLRSLQRLAHCVPTLPVIVLSAAPCTNDLVTALAIGAEDYLPWLCPLTELLARIQAVLRRTSPDRPRPPQPEADGHLDEECRQTREGNLPLPVSPLRGGPGSS